MSFKRMNTPDEYMRWCLKTKVFNYSLTHFISDNQMFGENVQVIMALEKKRKDKESNCVLHSY